MAQTTPYPPSVIPRPIPISEELALEKIQSYLSLASTHAYLHPSATLSERGPVANLSSSAGKGGIVLHNLQRIEAGLRGERWGEDPPVEEEEVLEVDEGLSRKKRKKSNNEEQAELAQDEGEDLEDYQLHQEVLEGDVGQRHIGIAERVPIEVQSNTTGGAGGKQISKEEKKRLKKERRALEQKERAIKRQKQKG